MSYSDTPVIFYDPPVEVKMPTAQECKKVVYGCSAKEIVPYEICSEILRAVSMQIFHADWYSRLFTEDDYEYMKHAAEKFADYLQSLGYKCTFYEFEPDGDFLEYRLKLHINWE